MSTYPQPKMIAPLWRLLTSIRLTVVLLLILALVALIGTVVPQDQPPGQYVARFGETLGRILMQGGFARIYYSPWFLTPVSFLALNILACLIHGLPQAIKRAAPRFTGEMAAALPERGRFSWPAGSDPRPLAAAIFRRELGRPQKEDFSDKEIYFYQRGRLRPLGPYLVHLALLLILAGGLIGKFKGVEGRLTLLEGTRADAFDLDHPGKTEPLNFQVRLDRFQVHYYQDGTPKEYISDLTFSRDGLETGRGVCKVNDPVTFGRFTFYQSSYGTRPTGPVRLTVRHGDTNVSIEAPFRRLVELPGGEGRLMVVRVDGNLQGYGPAVQLVFGRGGGHPQVFWALKDHPQMATQPESYRFTVVDLPFRYYSVFQVKYDPGVWWVYSGFLLLLPGLYLAFFRPTQRWALILEKNPQGGWQGRLLGASPRAREAFAARRDRLLELLKKGTPP